MKTRQFVLNDPAVAAYVKENFIAVSASDVAYNNLPTAAKAKGEYQFLRKALTGAPNGIHQGIYMVSPSGVYLGKASVGWPNPDPQKALDFLRKAAVEYRSVSGEKYRGKVALLPEDRSMPADHDIVPLPEWLKIRTTTRSYSFPEMDLFDLRHPAYYKLDRLWMTQKTARTLLPGILRVGEKAEVSGQALRHLTYDGHFMLGCPPWPDAAVKKTTMSVEIIGKKGNLYDLRYTGDLHLDSHSQWNKSSYEGRLLGKAVWDDSKKKFTSLKWVTLGKRNRRELKSNETKSKIHITTVGSVFELDPMHTNDRGLAPHSWEDRYTKAMKQAAKH